MLDILGAGLAFGGFFILGILPFALLSLAIPYAILRLRNEQPWDPQLGLKAGLQFFFSVAIVVGLMGLSVMAVDLLTHEDSPQPVVPVLPGRPPPVFRSNIDNGWFNATQRMGLGLLVSGLLFTLVYFLLAQTMTNRFHWTQVRRTFAGWRFAIHASVVMFAMSYLIILVLQKDPFEGGNFKSMKAFFAILVVWTPSWMIHLALLRFAARVPYAAGPDKKLATEM